MAGESIDYVLNLDDTEFAKTIISAGERVTGLVGSLEGVAAMGGVIGVAFLAVKTALDLTKEAEQVKQINQQFEMLSANAGLASKALKDGLVEAANGLVDDTDLLHAANKAII